MNHPKTNPRARISAQPITLHVTPLRTRRSLTGQRMRMLAILALNHRDEPVSTTLFSRN